MTIIEQIKAEIERLTDELELQARENAEANNGEATDYCFGVVDMQINLLSFLDTLESEKPMNLDELMKEAQRYYSDNFEYLSSDQPTLSILTNIARHFAQWGANHTPLPEDTVLFQKGVAEGKRLMMEEAVEGDVVKDISNKLAVTAKINLDGFKFGDKVRVIVLPKEDEK